MDLTVTREKGIDTEITIDQYMARKRVRVCVFVMCTVMKILKY